MRGRRGDLVPRSPGAAGLVGTGVRPRSRLGQHPGGGAYPTSVADAPAGEPFGLPGAGGVASVDILDAGGRDIGRLVQVERRGDVGLPPLIAGRQRQVCGAQRLERLPEVGGGGEQVLARILLADPRAVDPVQAASRWAMPGVPAARHNSIAAASSVSVARRRCRRRDHGTNAPAATSAASRWTRAVDASSGRTPASGSEARRRRSRPGPSPVGSTGNGRSPHRLAGGRWVRSLASASQAGGPWPLSDWRCPGNRCHVTLRPLSGSTTIGSDHSSHLR